MASHDEIDTERRLTLRFVRRWREAAGDRPYARLVDLMETDFDGFADHRFVIALSADRAPVLIRIGPGLAPPAPKAAAYSALEDLPPNCLTAQAAAPWRKAVSHAAPQIHGGGYANAAGQETWFRAAIAPATTDGATLNALVGVASRRLS
ncbi:MAG: hypothetical protein AAF684_05090 [Pseudomonadota bacterium]